MAFMSGFGRIFGGAFMSETRKIEWPTLLALALCYSLWGLCLIAPIPTWIAIVGLGVTIAFQASLQHEIIHGHPFVSQHLNEALVFPSLNLAIPYLRFRDTHLAHHKNENLTDPYDDPETNYLAPAGWTALCVTRRTIMRANATLLGRIVVGPLVGQIYFMIGDIRLIARGDLRVLTGWLWHIPSVLLVLAVVTYAGFPIWAYLCAAYIGLSLLKIRTYPEHQAHEKVGPRTAVIEGGWFFSLLFLNNNLHIVHHMHPQIPWYALPEVYRARKERFLRRNGGYRFESYRALFKSYILRAKEPIIHPLWKDRAK